MAEFPKFEPNEPTKPVKREVTSTPTPKLQHAAEPTEAESSSYDIWTIGIVVFLALSSLRLAVADYESKRHWRRSIEDVLNDLDVGSSLMRWTYLCLLWFILLMLVQINRTIRNQTTRLLNAAKSQKRK